MRLETILHRGGQLALMHLAGHQPDELLGGLREFLAQFLAQQRLQLKPLGFLDDPVDIEGVAGEEFQRRRIAAADRVHRESVERTVVHFVRLVDV